MRFAYSWEQRKFSDFVLRESVFQASSSEYPSVEYEDVVAEEGRLNKDIRQKETQKTGIVFDGTQVLYGKLRPYLHNWLNPDFTGVAVGDWWVLRPVGADKKFLYRLIQTQQFDEVANQSSGSKMPRADWNLVSNTEFIIPSSLDEQRQIAGTFDDLDNLITLHQREESCAASFSASCFGTLKAFFWEQRKLDEFVSFFSGLTYSPADIRPAGTLVLRSSNVKDGEVVDADNVYVDPTVVNSENVRDGDIIVVVRNGSRALIGKHAEIKGFKPNTVIGAFMTGIRSEHPSFLNALLNTPRFDKEVEMNMGATINQITGYMFSKMEFMVPSSDEQDIIGDYFKKLDNLITLHQCKPKSRKGGSHVLYSYQV